MSNSKQYKSVEDYFDNQSENSKKALIELRDCIYEVAPNAVELLNYNIPAYALIEGWKKEQQIMIAGYKNHVGLYPHPTVIAKFDSEISGYKKSKGSVQFPLNKDLPKQLIKKMLEYRVEQLKKE